jgi:general secretion pathway protein G
MKYILKDHKAQQIYGFTLIELIVVMAIMAILAMVGLANYQTSLQNGRDNRRKLDLKSIASALQMYYSDNSAYPGGSYNNSSYSIPSALEPNYIKVRPHDPKFTGGEDYQYMVSGTNNQCFCVSAKIERSVNAKDETNGNCSAPTAHATSYLVFCP